MKKQAVPTPGLEKNPGRNPFYPSWVYQSPQGNETVPKLPGSPVMVEVKRVQDQALVSNLWRKQWAREGDKILIKFAQREHILAMTQHWFRARVRELAASPHDHDQKKVRAIVRIHAGKTRQSFS